MTHKTVEAAVVPALTPSGSQPCPEIPPDPEVVAHEVRPFRTISVMVNSVCNLSCPHCDLPRKYERYGGGLGPDQWNRLLSGLIPQIEPEVVSVAAMEPLLPGVGDARTLAVLQTAMRLGIARGFVTNGIFAERFFTAHGSDLHVNFMDVSVDGPPEVDRRVRGEEHFAIVDRFLRSSLRRNSVERTYVSCVLTKWNSAPDVLKRFLEWVRDALDQPRLVLLLLYPNEHVDPALMLDDSDVRRVLDMLVAESDHFEDLFLELFPPSLPGLAQLVNEGMLPGAGELQRDAAGMLWGHVAGNLFVRFENMADLELYHLRISPEGLALPPESLERADYQIGAYGSLLDGGWPEVHRRILEGSRRRSRRSIPTDCQGRACRLACRSENHRCPVISHEN